MVTGSKCQWKGLFRLKFRLKAKDSPRKPWFKEAFLDQCHNENKHGEEGVQFLDANWRGGGGGQSTQPDHRLVL